MRLQVGSFQSSKRFYFVLEFCSGGELLERVRVLVVVLDVDTLMETVAEVYPGILLI